MGASKSYKPFIEVFLRAGDKRPPETRVHQGRVRRPKARKNRIACLLPRSTCPGPIEIPPAVEPSVFPFSARPNLFSKPFPHVHRPASSLVHFATGVYLNGAISVTREVHAVHFTFFAITFYPRTAWRVRWSTSGSCYSATTISIGICPINGSNIPARCDNRS